ncbi:MAG TPA: YtxH domain-containing protein [Ktedonobacteraceae bacterium]|nr:YtxH domain-containing protein [Ktedonobacteraceae bacterium]
MKGLVTGLFLGVGVGLLFAPMRGEEMRRLLNEQFLGTRGNELLKQFAPLLATDLSQVRKSLDSLTRFALSSVKADEATLTGLARLAVDRLMKYRVPVSLNDLVDLASVVMKKAS